MNKAILMTGLLCLSMLGIFGCFESLEKDTVTGVKIEERVEDTGTGAETPGVKDETASETGEVKETVAREVKEGVKEEDEEAKPPENEVPAAEDEWVIPRDANLSARFFADLADVFIRYRRIDKAKLLFDEAISREQNDDTKSSYYSKLANTYNRTNNLEGAAEAYEKAAELTKSDELKMKLYSDLAKIYTRLQSYEKGIQVYTYLYEHEKEGTKKIAVKRQMYTMYNKAGRIAEPLKKYEDQLKEDPKSVEALEELAFIQAHITKQQTRALPYLRTLADMAEPKDKRKYLNQLVGLYRGMNMHDQHAGVMIEIMELLPEINRVSYMLRIAQIYTEGKNTKKALEFAEGALAKKPDDPYTMFRLADTYTRNRLTEKGDELFEKALALTEEPMQKQSLLFQYATSYIAISDYAKADKLFERQDKLAGDKAMKIQLYQPVAEYFRTAEQPELAEKWIRKIISLDPKEIAAYFRAAEFFDASKDFRKSRDVLTEGIKAMEENSKKIQLMIAHYARSMQLKDWPAARSTLDEIAEITDQEKIIKWVNKQKKKLPK